MTDECWAPDPTKRQKAIDDAQPDGVQFTNLDIADRLRADGGELALAALQEIERLHAEHLATVANLRAYFAAERQACIDSAKEPRKKINKEKINEASLLTAIAEHRKEASEAGNKLLTGFKISIATKTGFKSWRALLNRFDKWDEARIREMLK